MTAPPRFRSLFQLLAHPLLLPPSSPLLKRTCIHTISILSPRRISKEKCGQVTLKARSRLTLCQISSDMWVITWARRYRDKLHVWAHRNLSLHVCWFSVYKRNKERSALGNTPCLPAQLLDFKSRHVLIVNVQVERPTSSLTPLVVLAVLRVPLHAVVQLHQDWLQARVHPLDQLMVHHQWPQQHTENWKGGKRHIILSVLPILFRRK